MADTLNKYPGIGRLADDVCDEWTNGPSVTVDDAALVVLARELGPLLDAIQDNTATRETTLRLREERDKWRRR